jgi:hypothetical protein
MKGEKITKENARVRSIIDVGTFGLLLWKGVILFFIFA